MEGNTNKKSSLPDNVLTVNNLSVKYKNITAVNDVSGFKIICYSETVQAYGFGSAQAAFEKIR